MVALCYHIGALKASVSLKFTPYEVKALLFAEASVTVNGVNSNV